MLDQPIDETDGDWTKEYTSNARQVDDLLNGVPVQGALVHTHHHAASDFAERAQAARTVIQRDMAALTEEARRIGRRLGADAYYSWQVENKGGSKQIIEGVSIDAVQELANAFGAFDQEVVIEKIEGVKVWVRISVTDFVTMRSARVPAVFTLSGAPGKYGADRWMAMQINAAASKAMRSAMERILPRSLLNLVLSEAKRVVYEAGRNTEPATKEAVTAWERWAAKRGATLDQIGEAVGRRPGTPWTKGHTSMLMALSKQMETEGLTFAEAFGIDSQQGTNEGGLGGTSSSSSDATATPTGAPSAVEALRIQVQESEEAKGAPTAPADLARWRGERGLTASSLEKTTEAQLRAYLAKLNA